MGGTVKKKLLTFFKNRTVWLAAAAIIITVVVVLCLPTKTEYAISIPSPATTGDDANSSIRRADVTKDTVQSVLKTLQRAESYSRVYKITTLWSGGESESTLSVWKNSSKIRISISRGGTVKNILIDGSNLSIWYDGSSNVFHSTLSDAAAASELDEFSRLVTYEDILGVPADDVLVGDYVEHAGQSCISAKYKSNNYVNQIYVSIRSGLLVSAEIDDGDTPVYKMESVSTDLTAPAENFFTAPA